MLISSWTCEGLTEKIFKETSQVAESDSITFSDVNETPCMSVCVQLCLAKPSCFQLSYEADQELCLLSTCRRHGNISMYPITCWAYPLNSTIHGKEILCQKTPNHWKL